MDFENILLLLSWGILVGIIFSSIGAAGGILASFGLISLLGITDPNSVKPMSQIIAIAIALIFILSYLKRKSCVFPLGLMLSLGGIAGAIIGSTISSKYLSDMSSFKPFFGLLCFLVAIQILWNIYKQRESNQPNIIICDKGVENLSFSLLKITFDYAEKSYSIHTWSSVLAGFVIAFISSIFGVGGGFLLVPYLASVVNIPMFIVPATAALAVVISGIISVSNYMRMGSEIDFEILLLLVVGGVFGALIGPKINQIVKESWLQTTLAFIVTMIGMKYLLV